ncbi:MAG: class I SAM-dependent methyltransferase [Anaerolineales bacterium]|jgi:SAM-dependent methyltransferase|nr:class I SAM-dependent methyltransferase [Anaerolineales bacterium]
MESIYDLPQIYQIILEKPTEIITIEVDTLNEVLDKYGIRGGHLLNLGCRTAPHALLLAQRGFEVTALDPSAAMLAEAQAQAERLGIEIKTVRSEEVDFDLEYKKFVAAFFMFENFPQITRYAEIRRNFAAVRRHLRDGGLYIVDVDSLTHGIVREESLRGRKTIVLKNGYAERWFEDLPGDWEAGTNTEVLNARIMLDDSLHETRDVWEYRMYTPWDLELLACGLDGWVYVGSYSWRGLRLPLANEEHYFGVFQKVG